MTQIQGYYDAENSDDCADDGDASHCFWCLDSSKATTLPARNPRISLVTKE